MLTKRSAASGDENVRRDVEFNESDFGQKSAMTTEPDQKSMEVKQNGEITAKDEEEVAEIRRSEKDEERQEPQEETELKKAGMKAVLSDVKIAFTCTPVL